MHNKIWKTNVEIAGHILKNPIVFPAVGMLGLDTEDTISAKRIEHYVSIAKGGVGMIIVEATKILPEPKRIYPIMPSSINTKEDTLLGIYTSAQIKGFSHMVELCKKENVVMLLQLAYTGLDEPLEDRLLSDMSVESLYVVQQAFVKAAMNAKQAGFDGIELHAAHGLFLSQVLSPVINDRTDLWGGNVQQRTNYLIQIIQDIKRMCGENFAIGVRMGCNEPNLATSIKIAKLLEQGGADFLDISTGISSRVYIGLDKPEIFLYSEKIYAAWQIYKQVKIPVIAVGGITKAEDAIDILEKKYAPLVGVARGILADYEWPNKAQQGITINICHKCKHCQWYVDAKNCPAKNRSIQ
ncbi:MAG: NADH:flavin oxidoreductase [Peptococcaceae bacterium]